MSSASHPATRGFRRLRIGWIANIIFCEVVCFHLAFLSCRWPAVAPPLQVEKQKKKQKNKQKKSKKGTLKGD